MDPPALHLGVERDQNTPPPATGSTETRPDQASVITQIIGGIARIRLITFNALKNGRDSRHRQSRVRVFSDLDLATTSRLQSLAKLT